MKNINDNYMVIGDDDDCTYLWKVINDHSTDIIKDTHCKNTQRWIPMYIFYVNSGNKYDALMIYNSIISFHILYVCLFYLQGMLACSNKEEGSMAFFYSSRFIFYLFIFICSFFLSSVYFSCCISFSSFSYICFLSFFVKGGLIWCCRVAIAGRYDLI